MNRHSLDFAIDCLLMVGAFAFTLTTSFLLFGGGKG